MERASCIQIKLNKTLQIPIDPTKDSCQLASPFSLQKEEKKMIQKPSLAIYGLLSLKLATLREIATTVYGYSH